MWSHRTLIYNIASYGLAGEEVIIATLRHRIFLQSKDSSTVLAATLADIFNAEEGTSDRVGFWNGFRPMSFPLWDFILFVAGPFVANLLIAEDNSITEAEAQVIRLESAKYGKTVHPTNDSIDDLVMMIAAPERVSNLELFSFIDFLTLNTAAKPC